MAQKCTLTLDGPSPSAAPAVAVSAL